MKIIVFGASGSLGVEMVKLALAKGHQVTAFVRNRERFEGRFGMSTSKSDLTIFVGDALNSASVFTGLTGHDAVISCLGGNGLSADPVMYKMVENIIAGMNTHGMNRIAYCASAGIHNEIPAPAGWFVWLFLRHVLADHRKSFERLQRSGLDWTIARPMQLTTEPARGSYRTTVKGIPSNGRMISRADVASFLLEAVTERRHIGESVGLAY